MRAVRVLAPAKVNLHLGVGSLRPDGYHDVQTVLHTLAFGDEVSLDDGQGLSVTCDADLGIAAEDNLAYRAALVMAEAFGTRANVRIDVRKRVPSGAGLGGGSSDAAAVIAGLARLWSVDSDDARCVRVARALGADVAFFLRGGAALFGGRGDELVRTLPALVTPVVLVRPQAPAPTALAYRAFDAAPVEPPEPGAMIAALEARDAGRVAAGLANNLEAAAVSLVPEVGDALAWLRTQEGVAGCAVAGSGSAVFGLARSEQDATRAAQAAAERGWWSHATRLAGAGVTVSDEKSST